MLNRICFIKTDDGSEMVESWRSLKFVVSGQLEVQIMLSSELGLHLKCHTYFHSLVFCQLKIEDASQIEYLKLHEVTFMVEYFPTFVKDVIVLTIKILKKGRTIY